MVAVGLIGGETNMRRREIRERVRAGDLTLAELLAEPPEAVHGVRLFEPVRWQPRVGWRAIETLNRQAILNGVNLLLPVGQAGELTRRWVIENAPPFDRRTRRRWGQDR